jgi:hypothetical protein
MLAPFPLFYLSAFAPTILRILVGLTLLWVAYAQIARRKEISHTGFPFIGRPHPLLVIISGVIIGLDALALIVGYGTQYAALLGMALSIKHAIYAKKYPRAIPLCRLEYIYIFVILVTLFITGAGLFAFDIPNL